MTARSEDFSESLRKAKTLGDMVDLATRARDAGKDTSVFKADFDRKLLKLLHGGTSAENRP